MTNTRFTDTLQLRGPLPTSNTNPPSSSLSKIHSTLLLSGVQGGNFLEAPHPHETVSPPSRYFTQGLPCCIPFLTLLPDPQSFPKPPGAVQVRPYMGPGVWVLQAALPEPLLGSRGRSCPQLLLPSAVFLQPHGHSDINMQTAGWQATVRPRLLPSRLPYDVGRRNPHLTNDNSNV